jgi:nitroreductase
MFTLIKRLLPAPVKRLLHKIFDKYILSRQVWVDINRYRKFAFALNGNNDIHNLFARLTLHTHAIEKGLSNPNIRIGFGQNALKSLKETMLEYKTAGYNLNEERFLSAFIVLQKYCDLHKDYPEYTSNIYEFLELFVVSPPPLQVGAVEYHKEQILEKAKLSFDKLASSRISVRDYSPVEVDDNLIYDSINIAMKTPSVCNRHSWRVHFIKDKELLAKTLLLQGGFRGNGLNLGKLLLVTVDLRYFSSVNERNEGYIDGGIFLMSLVYALTYNGIATCILNAMFNKNKDEEIRKLLGIEDPEILIGFIALGNYPDTFKVPASLRDSSTKCLRIH